MYTQSMKVKILPEDKKFSDFIRSRDDWTCQRCYTVYEPPTSALHCSHFWSRRHWATRFDEDNCVALCFGCHRLWESDKHGEYRDFMLEMLGEEDYAALEERAKSTVKKREALEYARDFLSNVKI